MATLAPGGAYQDQAARPGYYDVEDSYPQEEDSYGPASLRNTLAMSFACDASSS